MTVYRLTASHPDFPLLTIERFSLTQLMLDYGGLAAEGWSLVGDPEAVLVDERQEVTA